MDAIGTLKDTLNEDLMKDVERYKYLGVILSTNGGIDGKVKYTLQKRK